MMAAAEARRSQSAMGAYSLPRSETTYLERQTSTDTGYNVPSIRSEQVRFSDQIDFVNTLSFSGALRQVRLNRRGQAEARETAINGGVKIWLQ